MKGGKNDEKIMGPMFPRLHVNDTDKGGPRAPPRNKMALYEQLSIPSQRFSPSVRPVNSQANSEQVSPEGVAHDSGMFPSYQLPDGNQSEKIRSHYSDFTAPLTPVVRKKKSDEDDFRVPIFNHSVQSQEFGKYGNKFEQEKVSLSDPTGVARPLEFHKFNKTGLFESSVRQEGKCQTEEIPKQSASDRAKIVSKSSSIEKAGDLNKQIEPRDSPANSIDRIQRHDTVETELRAHSDDAVFAESFEAVDERNTAAPLGDSPTRDERDSYDSGNSNTRSHKRSLSMRNMERAQSLCEISVGSVVKLDVTPDDVVGIIGQKHFWKARKAILNQQRVFAFQVFELHRLVEVQRLIAESPHFLVENSAFIDKPNQAKTPSASPVKAIPDVSGRRGEAEKLSQNKESSAENTTGKASFSPIQIDVPRSGCRPLTGNSPTPALSLSSNTNAGPWCFNQPQWLIPVMTPSEGLVYKPYPGPGFVGSAYGPPGPNPGMSNFMPPAYPIPAFPPAGSHGYFPTYGIPMMNASAISGSSVEQMNPKSIPSQASAGEASVSIQHHNLSSTPVDKNRGKAAEASRVSRSSPIEKVQDSSGSNAAERANVLSLFPGAPCLSPAPPEPDRPTQVIKVVPHNARSATESAARIFRSIQEERKQYDYV